MIWYSANDPNYVKIMKAFSLKQKLKGVGIRVKRWLVDCVRLQNNNKKEGRSGATYEVEESVIMTNDISFVDDLFNHAVLSTCSLSHYIGLSLSILYISSSLSYHHHSPLPLLLVVHGDSTRLKKKKIKRNHIASNQTLIGKILSFKKHPTLLIWFHPSPSFHLWKPLSQPPTLIGSHSYVFLFNGIFFFR